MDEHPSKRLQEATTTKFQDDDDDDDDAEHQGGAVASTMEETKSIVKAVSNKSPTRRNEVDDAAALKEQRTNAWNSVCKYVVEVDPSSDFSESSIIMDDNNNNINEGKTKTTIMHQEKKVTSLGAATSPSPELAPSSNHQNNSIHPGAVHMLGGSSPHQASDREIEWGDTAVLLDAVPVDENNEEHHVPATLPEAVTAIQVSEEEEDESPTGISLIFRNRQVFCIVVLLVIVSVSLAAGLLASDGTKHRNESKEAPSDSTAPPSVPPTAVSTLYWNKVDSFDGLDDGQTDEGYRLSMSGDGTVLAASPRSHGTARFFNKKDGRWTEIVNLRLNRTDNDSLGSDVSLSNDGKRVALGSNMYNGTNSFQGKVEIFDLDDSSGTWTNSQVIIYGDMYNEQSGYSVALSKDGLTLAVGVPTRTWWREQDPEDGKNPPALGHVRVYRRFDASSSDPVQIAGIDGVEKCDFCGGSVALSKDGSVFAFGCPSTCDGIGHVRVFYWVQDEGTDETKGTWKQRGKNIKGEGNTWFGFSIDLSDDGNLLAVGAPKGSYAKVFQWKDGNGDEDEEWEQVGQRLGVDVIDFGVMVSLSKPPNSSCVSAILATNDRHNVHTYRLKLGNDRWEELADVLPGGDVSLSSDGRTIGVARNVDPGVITVYDELETACDTRIGSNDGDPH